MGKKNHILICTLCDFYIGFDIDQVNQIVQKKQAHLHAHGSIVEFRGYTVPFFNLSEFFNCSESECNFVLLLNSESGSFFVPIRSIEAIVDVESDAGVNTAKSMKTLIATDYTNRIIIWNNLPIPVIETKKLMEGINAEE